MPRILLPTGPVLPRGMAVLHWVTFAVLALFQTSPLSRAATPPTPSLLTQRLPDGKIRVAWQSPLPRFVLESTEHLGTQANWQTVAQSVREDRGTFSLDLPSSQSARFLRLRLALTQVGASSPSPGETGVSVHRETILQLTGALSPEATVAPGRLLARSAGRTLLTRAEVSSDRRRLSLFYLEPLPGNARVSVTFDGDDLEDEFGLPLDPDGDGSAGGTAQFWFDTLNLTPIAGTAVVGRVFAAELQSPNAGTPVPQPLAGVTVTVDGREQDLRAVTDAQGFFRLEPVPSGRFFVHIDGRTAATSDYPQGEYYPAVGKAWEAIPGVSTNLAGGTGEIFLPRIQGRSLQPVSSVEPTIVGFDDAVIAAQPALALARITVPPNSLFSDDGSRGGRLGMAPVPPERLPGPLPPGLELANVFTVQTDGALNFDEPAAVCLPNNPAVVAGAPLPPGTKRSLISFDHKKGIWESVGLMTVSADGTQLCTDPGSGIRQPGWHGAGVPAFRGGGGFASQGGAAGLGATGGGSSVGSGSGSGFGGSASGSAGGNRPAPSPGSGGSAGGSGGNGTGGGGGGGGGGNGGNDNGSGDGSENESCPEAGLDECLAVANAEKQRCDEAKHAALDQYKQGCDQLEQRLGKNSPEFQACFRTYRSLYFQATVNCNDLKAAYTRECAPCAEGPIPSEAAAAGLHRSGAWSPHASASDALADQVRALLDAATDRLAVFIEAGQPIPEADFAEAQAWFDQADALAGGDAGWFLLQESGRTELAASASFDSFGLRPGNAPSYPIRYHALVHRPGGPFSIRGETGPFGAYEIFIPSDGTLLAIEFYDPLSGQYGRAYPNQMPRGLPSAPPFRLFDLPSNALDQDQDGLPDAAEVVIGTQPTLRDSDQDGVPDGTEIDQGANPLDGIAVRPGVIAAVDTPGRAVDIVVEEDLAVIADGAAGVAIFDIANPLRPVLAAQVDTPGDASGVAMSAGHVAVADGSAGLAIIDLGAPLPWRVRQQLDLESAAVAVTAQDGIAFVGLDSRDLIAIDLFTAIHLDRLRLATSGAIQDLLVRGNTLLVLTANELVVVSLAGERLAIVAKVPAPGLVPGSFRRKRLALSQDLLYATHRQGFTVFDLRDPAAPALTSHHVTPQFGWKQLIPVTPTLALAVAGPDSTPANNHDLHLYDLGPDGTNAVFVNTLRTPGVAIAASYWKGLALVADDQAGLQILSPQAADSLGFAPTVTLNAPSLHNPDSILEGQPFSLTASALDDNLVRDVAFFMDGVAAATSGRHPFIVDMTAPVIGPNRTTIRVQARATDTSGNARWSEPLILNLLPDSTPPEVVYTVPAEGRFIAGPTSLVLGAVFTERLAGETINPATFQLQDAGPNGLLGDADDQVLSGSQVGYRDDVQTVWLDPRRILPPGRYRATLHSSVADAAGNPLGTSLAWDFTVHFVDISQGGAILADGRIERSAVTDVLTFKARAGQAVYFDEVLGTCTSGLQWRCLAPDSSVLFDETLGGLSCGRDVGRLTLPLDGTYTLAITGERGATNAWSIAVHDVPEPSVVSLAVGDAVLDGQPAPGAGRIEHPGSRDVYVFPGSAGQTLFFHEQTGDCTTPLSWKLIGPDGTTHLDQTLGGAGCGRNAGRIVLPGNGDYRIEVRGDGDAVGAYGFTVWDATPQRFDITTTADIRDGQPAVGAGNLETPGAMDIYTFTAAPGSKVRFNNDGAAEALTSIRWALMDEVGTVVFDSCLACTDPGLIVLNRGGTYTLLVGDATNSGTGAYQLQLTPVP